MNVVIVVLSSLFPNFTVQSCEVYEKHCENKITDVHSIQNLLNFHLTEIFSIAVFKQ